MTFEEIRKQLESSDSKSASKPAASTPQSRFEELRNELNGQSSTTDENPELSAFISGVLEQLDKKQGQSQAAQQTYQQAKSQYTPPAPVSSYAAAFQNKPAAPVTGSPYAAAQQDPAQQMSEGQKQLIKLKQNADALESEVSALKDQATYAQQLQTILSMPEDVRQALATEAEYDGANSIMLASPPKWLENYKEWQTGREIVTKDEVNEKRTAARTVLSEAGYTDEQIKNLAETYTRYQNQQNAQQRQQQTQQKVNSSGGSALLQNILAVPSNIAGAIYGGVGTAVEAMERGFEGSQYSSLDPNLEAYKYSQHASDVRSQTRQNIEDGNGALGKVGGVLYGATTSAVDNLARIAVAGPTGSLALAGLGSFQDSVRDVSGRGGNAMQAYGMGVTTAAFEILTEKVSLDNLIDTPSPTSIAQALKNAAIQGGIEVTEEELNFAATTIADALIMGDKSNIRQQYNELVAGGKSSQEASRQVMQGLLLDAVNVAAESFLSGGLMSAGKQTGDYLSNRKSGSGTQAEEAQEAVQQPQQQPQRVQTPQSVQQPQTSQNATQSVPVPSAKQAESAVDTQPQPGYDNITATQKGANTYAQRLQQNDRAGSPADSAVGMAGVQRGDGTGAERWPQHGRLAVHPGILRVSEELETAQKRRGTPTYSVYDTTADPERYEQALIAGRNSDPKNGWCVTPKSAQELRDGNVRTFLNENGTVGVGIAPDGDIVAVFKNKNGGPRKALDTAMPMAIEQGGDRLDCYGEGLVDVYARYGFTPVARVEFNPEYANEGWTPDKPTPYIYVMMHNGDSASQVASNIGSYRKYTQADLDSLPTYGKDDYDAAMQYRDQLIDQQKTAVGDDDHIVPNESSSIPKETESVGAAPQGFDPYSDLQYRYGNQPDRANDARPVNVPKKDTYGRKVSASASNIYGANALSERDVQMLEDLIVDGAFGYETQHMSDVHESQINKIRKNGLYRSRKAIMDKIATGKYDSSDIASAQILFAAYSNRNGYESQEAASDLAVGIAEMAREYGRGLNMFKLLRKLTPEGKLMAVQKNVEKEAESVNKSRSKKNQVAVEVAPELFDEYLNAAREDAQNPSEATKKRMEEAEQAIYEDAAAQIGATSEEVWNEWRRMAMLFNPKTQIRNFFGNTAFIPYVDAKRAVGAALEKAFLKQEQRTKSVLGTSENDRRLHELAKQDAAVQQGRMDYNAAAGDIGKTQIEDARQIFKNNALEKARTGLGEFMEKTDMLFKHREYSLSLAGFLKARGYTAAQWEAGKVPDSVLEEGRTYAAKEAMKATFNDRNRFSDLLCKMRYKGNDPALKVLNAAGEGILPFLRTPANVAVRAVEYSPAGFVKAAYQYFAKVRSGKMTAAECIDSLSAGLTGTGAIALGAALASGIFGIRLVGALDDEDEKRVGHQAYAIEIGDRSFTIDWLAPANIPLFVGANLYGAWEKAGEEDVSELTAFLYAAAHTLEPMLELSCLSSLNDLLQNARYAEKGTVLYSLASSVATSYFMQGLPTIFSQWDTAANKRRQTVYQDSSDPVLGEVQRLLGRVFQKLPGDPYQTDYVDAWGRTEDQTAYGVVESLLLPFYGNKIDRNAVDAEIQRLNEVQDTNVSPSTPSKTIKANGVERRLTGKEWSALAKAQGQLQYDIVSMLMNNSAYDSLTDAQKADVISDAYTYAKERARKDTHLTSEGLSDKWMQEIDATSAKSIAAGIIDYHLQQSIGMTEKQYSDAKAAGFSTDAMSIVDSLLASLTPEAGHTDVTKAQRIEIITGSEEFASEEKEKWLYWLLDESDDKKLDAAKDLGLSAEEYAVAYRLYSDETNTGGKGTKNRIVSGLMEKFDIDEKTAESLYKVYKGTYDD